MNWIGCKLYEDMYVIHANTFLLNTNIESLIDSNKEKN